MLIRLLSICIFSVHYGYIDYTATGKEVSIVTSLRQHRSYATGESLSLLFVYEIVNKCVIRLAGDRVISSNSSSNKKLNEKITNRILPLLNVFIEWVQYNFKYMPLTLDETKSADVSNIMGNLTPKLQELVSSENIMQILSKSMSTLLTNIQNLRSKYSSNDIKDTGLTHVPLPEHTELNGFLPFSELHNMYFNTPSSSSRISHDVIAVPDDVSKIRRVSTLITLLNGSTTLHSGNTMDEESINQAERVKEDVLQVQAVNKVVGGLLPISVLNTTTNSSEKPKVIKKTKKSHDDKRLWTPSSSTESKSKIGGSSNKQRSNKRGESSDDTHHKAQNVMDLDGNEDNEIHEEEVIDVIVMEHDNNGANDPVQENIANTMFGVPGMFNWLQNNDYKLPLSAATAALDALDGNTNVSNNYFEDDIQEEEVVFRPVFSRVRSCSPTLQLSSSLRGIQSQSSFGDLLFGSSTETSSKWLAAPEQPERTYSNIIDTTFALLDEAAESERSNTHPYQYQHTSNTLHVQPPPGFR